MQEENETPQDEQRQIRAEAKLISDFYAGRLNAKGRQFVRMVMSQVNQDCYLRSTNDSANEQQPPILPRPVVVAAEGVKSADEINRYLDGLLKFSKRVLEEPTGLHNAIFMSAEHSKTLRNGTSTG